MELLLGIDRKSLTKTVINKTAENVANNQRTVLIVPEQYSYDAERLLCKKLGSCSSLTAEVLSFSRLADRAFSSCGNADYRNVDEGGKYVTCICALEMALPELKFFAAAMNRPESVMNLVRQIEEFKRYGVTWRKLRELASCFEGVFSQKLLELSMIYECYDTVSVTGSFDPSDRLAGLANLIWEHCLFEDVCFYFDGFTDFTVPQMEVIEMMMRMGLSLSFSFVYDFNHASCAPFTNAAITVGKLKAAAKRFAVALDFVHVPEESCNSSLATYVLCEQGGALPAMDRIHFFEMSTIYEECRRAAEEVKNLVMQGIRYQDITLACSSPEDYIAFIKPLFRQLDIPATLNEHFPLSSEPLVQGLLSGIQAAVNHYEKEDMLRYLKSPFSPLSSEDADVLENYLTMWRISGSRWEKEWEMDPSGYQKSDRSNPGIEELNNLRICALSPVRTLRNILLKANSCAEMTKAVFSFLKELDVSSRIDELCRKPGVELQRRTLIAQIPGALLDALEQLYSLTESVYKRPEEYVAILKNLLSVYSLKNIPACLDAVTFGSFDAVKYKASKCVLLLGCQEGRFPSYPLNSGILSDYERELLNRYSDEPACSDGISGLSRESSSIFDLLCSGESYYAFIWSGGNPSYLVKRLSILESAFPVSYEPARLIFDNSSAAVESARVSPSGMGSIPVEIQRARESLERQAFFNAGDLSADSVKSLYHERIRLSASKIELQASCRFAFFLKYGLRLREQARTDIDPALFGTMTHAVLQECLESLQKEGILQEATMEQIDAACEQSINRFLDRNIPDYSQREDRFQWMLRRDEKEIHSIVRDAVEEFRFSAFEPKRFELSFGMDCGSEAIHVHGSRGEAELTGVVDRVDVYHAGNMSYFRIADYKTGLKQFSYSDLMDGMGMQMLIYLFAMSSRKEFQNAVPAGILYIPAKNPLITMPFRPSDEEVGKALKKQKKRSGLILNDGVAIQAMERAEENYVYLPITRKKDGSLDGDLANRSELLLLRRLVDEKLSELTDEMYSGETAANPWMRDPGNSSCTYCPYGSVCRKNECRDEFRLLKEITNEEFFERLRGKYENRVD